MTRDNSFLINHLLKMSPRDSLLTITWLKKYGISYKLAWWYVQSGWLEHIANGAYCFPGNTVTWIGAVMALQQQLKLSIYPGAKTALQILGKSHYINMDLKTIQLFTQPNVKPPEWLHAPYWKKSFNVFVRDLFSSNNEATLTDFEFQGQKIKVSSPERAFLELCYLVPHDATFAETACILEGLTRMRPKLMQWLLENCKSYKAKRLLLYLAEYYDHKWVSEINLDQVDLGKGKRVIAGGGYYCPKYKISVPILENQK